MILNITIVKNDISFSGDVDSPWFQFVNKTKYLDSFSATYAAWGQRARVLLTAVCLGLVFMSPAQTNTNTVPLRGLLKRYLFVLETSHSMQRRADGTLQAIQDLLSGGIGGQLRRGDTIGVWTYDSELHVGGFPLQQWTPDTHRPVCLRIANFIKEQKYQGQAKLDKVLAAMESVVKDSPLITVILLSDGTQEIQGTPFDDRINESFKMWKSEQQSARMPLITILRGVEGKVTQFTVNPAQWQVEVPPLPAEYQKAQIAKAITNAPPKSPPAIGQSLYITGKKPAQPETPKASSTETTLAPSVVAPIEVPTRPPTPQTEATAIPLNPEPAPSKPEVVQTLPNKVEPAPTSTANVTAPAQPAPVAAPKAEDAKPTAPPNQAAGSVTLSNELVTHPAEPIMTPTEPSRNGPSETVAPEKAMNSMAKPSTIGRSAEAVVPTPAASLFPGILLWIAIGIVVLLFIGGVIVLRRSKPASQASLITRSIDRQEKR
jgi:hypothetical protein